MIIQFLGYYHPPSIPGGGDVGMKVAPSTQPQKEKCNRRCSDYFRLLDKRGKIIFLANKLDILLSLLGWVSLGLACEACCWTCCWRREGRYSRKSVRDIFILFWPSALLCSLCCSSLLFAALLRYVKAFKDPTLFFSTTSLRSSTPAEHLHLLLQCL